MNLASYLLRDGFKGEYESAILVTNDSDLERPVRMVRDELGLPVGALYPNHKHGGVLRAVAKFSRHIKTDDLAASQFPDLIQLPDGKTVHKPADW